MSVDTRVDPLGRLIDAIASGDVDAARDAYAPDARIWHNTELREQSVDENVRVLRWLVRNVPDLSYEEVRRQKTDRASWRRSSSALALARPSSVAASASIAWLATIRRFHADANGVSTSIQTFRHDLAACGCETWRACTRTRTRSRR